MKKVVSLLLCLTLLLGLAGCGAERIDQAPGQTEEQSESSAPTVENTESAETTSAEEDMFDIADVTGESNDFSKYEEVTSGTDNTDSDSRGHQKPVEPGDVTIDKENQKTCYLTISCMTILDNMENLAEGKEVLVPSDGIILPRTEVVFYEGESVFDLLLRETRSRGIHMESSFTPAYNSAYIEGIANLYEFDCGGESGWVYRVNGWFPNYGVSRYVVKQDDEIEFHYTCDLGRDVGSEGFN